jgi:hypothetical protein
MMCGGFWLALDAKEKEFAKGLWKKVRIVLVNRLLFQN